MRKLKEPVSPRTHLDTPTETHYGSNLPEHILIFSDDDSYSSGTEGIKNDSMLNEFIQDPEFNQIPMLERNPSYRQYFDRSYANAETRPIDIQSVNIYHYYGAEFISCLCVSISISSSILMLNIVNNADNSFIYYVLSRALKFFIAGYVTYMFTTPDTYRSINTSIDFLAINWALYSFDCYAISVYLLIQLITGLLGALLSVGLYYNIIASLDQEKLLNSIGYVSDEYLLTPSYIFLSGFIHVITVIGLTFIMDGTNSLNCRQKIIQRVTYMCGIVLLYGVIIGPIGFMAIYKLGLYLAISIIFQIKCHITVIATIVVHIVIKLLLYPFVAFHVKYVWKNAIQRYLEYR